MGKKSKRIAKLEKRLSEAEARLQRADGLLKALKPEGLAATDVGRQGADRKESSGPGSKSRRRVYLLAGLIALVVLGAALGAYFGLSSDDGDDSSDAAVIAVSPTAESSTTTSEKPLGSTSTAADTEPTETGSTETEPTETEPTVSLGGSDYGQEIVLRVGDSVRIELEPWATDQVNSVLWRYTPSPPVSVGETDSGYEAADGVVRKAWLHLRAVAEGKTTVRAIYRYPDGSFITTWVAYLIVRDQGRY